MDGADRRYPSCGSAVAGETRTPVGRYLALGTEFAQRADRVAGHNQSLKSVAPGALGLAIHLRTARTWPERHRPRHCELQSRTGGDTALCRLHRGWRMDAAFASQCLVRIQTAARR